MNFYGGNFTHTKRRCGEAQRVAENNVRNAEQQVKREKRQMQQARERAARRSSTAARNVKDAGLPKIIAGAMKRRAQESAGRIDGVNAARVDDAKARLDNAERSLRDDPSIVLDLPETEVPAGRNMFVGNGIRMSRGGRALFGDGIDVSDPRARAHRARRAATARARRHCCGSSPANSNRTAGPSGGSTGGSPTSRSGSTFSTRTGPCSRTSSPMRRI